MEGSLGGGDGATVRGGDEFAVVVVAEDEGGSIGLGIAERIVDALRPPFIVNGTSLPVSVSIGVAQRSAEVRDAVELLRRADFAMYIAKGNDKARYELLDPRMREAVIRR